MAGLADSVSRAKSLRLVVRGRKSGQPREVTIWFVVDGDDLVVGTLDDRRNWVRNARANPDVEVEIDGRRMKGRFADATDAVLVERARTALSRKYFTARVAGWFGVRQKHLFRIGDLRAA